MQHYQFSIFIELGTLWSIAFYNKESKVYYTLAVTYSLFRMLINNTEPI